MEITRIKCYIGTVAELDDVFTAAHVTTQYRRAVTGLDAVVVRAAGTNCTVAHNTVIAEYFDAKSVFAAKFDETFLDDDIIAVHVHLPSKFPS